MNSHNDKLYNSQTFSFTNLPPIGFFFLTFFTVEWILANLTHLFSFFSLSLAVISFDCCVIISNRNIWKRNKIVRSEIYKKMKSWIIFIVIPLFLFFFVNFNNTLLNLKILCTPINANFPNVYLYHMFLMIIMIILLELLEIKDRKFITLERFTSILIVIVFILFVLVLITENKEELIGRFISVLYYIGLTIIILQIINRANNFAIAIKSSKREK